MKHRPILKAFLCEAVQNLIYNSNKIKIKIKWKKKKRKDWDRAKRNSSKIVAFLNEVLYNSFGNKVLLISLFQTGINRKLKSFNFTFKFQVHRSSCVQQPCANHDFLHPTSRNVMLLCGRAMSILFFFSFRWWHECRQVCKIETSFCSKTNKVFAYPGPFSSISVLEVCMVIKWDVISNSKEACVTPAV